MIRFGCRTVSGCSIKIRRRRSSIDLRGKSIEGDVVLVVSRNSPLAWLRLDNATIDGSLIIRGDGEDCVPATLAAGAVAQIEGRGLTLSGDLRIEGVAIAGILLNNARIGGDVRIVCANIAPLVDAKCRTTPADAIRLRDARIEGSLFIRGGAGPRRSVLSGRTFVAGGRIGGTVEFAGIDFDVPPGNKTLTLANANIGGDLAWLDNDELGGACTFRGHVNVDSSHVGGRLRIAVRTTAPTVFSLKACEIDAAFQIRVEPGAADSDRSLEIDMSDASVDAIHVLGYQNKNWSLHIPGTTYAGLAGTNGADAKALPKLDKPFLDWFLGEVVAESARHRPGGGFSPQPYQHFIALCRSEGFSEVADDAIEAWVKGAYVQGPWHLIYRMFGRVSRYGLDPWRALRSCLWALALCTIMVGILQWTLPRSFVDPDPREVAATGVMTRVPGRADVPERYRIQLNDIPASDVDCAGRVNAFVYALDIMLPLADFRQESQCPQRGADGQNYWVAAIAVLFALFRLLGAILTAILLLTFSGINRRIWR